MGNIIMELSTLHRVSSGMPPLRLKDNAIKPNEKLLLYIVCYLEKVLCNFHAVVMKGI